MRVNVEKVEMSIDRKHGQGAHVSLYYQDGSVERREVECGMLIDALCSGTVSGTARWHSVGSLPEGYINVAFDCANTSTFRVALGFPGKKRLIKHYDKLYLVPMPRILMFIEVIQGRFTDMWIYSVRDDGVICNMPTPNVYGDGKVCWGSNEKVEIRELRDCEKAVSIFFDSAFNHDLFPAGARHFASFAEELAALEKEDSFPDKWLVPYGKEKLTEEDLRGDRGFVLGFLTR